MVQQQVRIFNNNRYVETFPIPNTDARDWNVRAEIFDTIWSGTGYNTTSPGGTHAYSNAEGIVVQTGVNNIKIDSTFGIGGHGSATNLTTAPCRVIVTYIGAVNE